MPSFPNILAGSVCKKGTAPKKQISYKINKGNTGNNDDNDNNNDDD